MTPLRIVLIAAVTFMCPKLAAAEERVISSLEFGVAALKDRSGQRDKDVHRQLANMALLIRQVQKDTPVTLPSSDQAALTKLKQKAADMTVDQIVSLMTRVLKKGLGVTGQAFAKIFTITSISSCADLPNCTGGTTKPDCARRFVMDTETTEFGQFIEQGGCAAALWSALSK